MREPKLGKLDIFPDGKLNQDDEGALRLSISELDGKVVVNFETEVAWLAMSPQKAADFASMLLRQARRVARANGETIDFTIY